LPGQDRLRVGGIAGLIVMVIVIMVAVIVASRVLSGMPEPARPVRGRRACAGAAGQTGRAP